MQEKMLQRYDILMIFYFLLLAVLFNRVPIDFPSQQFFSLPKKDPEN